MTDEAQCVGRQPAKLFINPSQEYPWYGTITGEERFTWQQRNRMGQLGLDHATIETIEVKRNATDREYYWGPGSRPPFFAFDCPVLERLKDGRIKVISPSGANKIVLASGWVTRPGSVKKRGSLF